MAKMLIHRRVEVLLKRVEVGLEGFPQDTPKALCKVFASYQTESMIGTNDSPCNLDN